MRQELFSLKLMEHKKIPKIDQKELKLAIKIMDNLMKHPIAEFFRKSIDIEDDNYYNIVKNPQNLDGIKERLSKGYYFDITYWYNDMETVWANTENYYGQDSYQASAAREMRKLFEKEREVFIYRSPSIWAKVCQNLHVKLNKYYEYTPYQLRVQLSPEILSQRPQVYQLDLTPHELESILLAIEMLPNEEIPCIKNIILENEPSIKGNFENFSTNLPKLSTKTLKTLKKYLKTSLKQKGLEFPE